jgi:hypothetical protein
MLKANQIQEEGSIVFGVQTKFELFMLVLLGH